MEQWIGIDVHKQTLVVATAQGHCWEIPNTPEGRAALVRDVQEFPPQRIVLEPSGGYERAVVETLQDADLPVSVVPAHRTRSFAVAAGLLAKTDRVDAQALAIFGHRLAPAITPVLSPTMRALAALSGRRRQLTDMLAAERRRLPGAASVIAPSLARHLHMLEHELTTLAAEMDAVIATDPLLQRRMTLLTSLPGVGEVTARLLLSQVPELGTRSAKAIAALVGVAPVDQTSGTSRRSAHIRGGREAVRTGLWMAPITAIRWNPVIRTFAGRLRNRRVSHKAMVIACMRKLLTILNAMLAHDTPFAPSSA